jgi:MFS family permease
MVMTGIGIQTTFQFSVGSRMRGRVLSLYGVVVIGGPAAGAQVIGALAEGLGLRPSLAAAVVVAALVWAWAWSRRGAVAEALRRSGTADQG